MNYISFCSGIEAATVAWHPLGWTPVAFCEIDKFASRVLANHYPDVPNLGDFTTVDWSQYSADICVGGTPCQAFSVAGLRNSLSDERGNLTLEFVRAINIIRPHTVVWENVPGVLSTSDNAFGCFLAALVGCDEPIVFEQGWPNSGVVDGPDRRAAWRILDAQYFGLAQRRKRVFVVANSGDLPHPAEILLEWEGLRRDSPPSRETGERTAGTIAARTRGGGGLGTDFEAAGGLQPVAMCLNGGGMNRIDAESETFITHSLRADGFDASEDGTVPGVPLVPVTTLAIRGRGDQSNLEYRTDGTANALLTPNGGRAGIGVGAIQQAMAVRRLLPEECEALQGFCRGFTNIPGAADGPRYKALGNSMAVPVMAWIGRRIKEAYAND
jgi:DNA (cytosine-5)-methyltransferase 1